MLYNRLVLVVISLLTIQLAMAQKAFDYSAAWNEVDSLIQKNLPKSAITLTDKIFAQAKKEKKEAKWGGARRERGRVHTGEKMGEAGDLCATPTRQQSARAGRLSTQVSITPPAAPPEPSPKEGTHKKPSQTKGRAQAPFPFLCRKAGC